VTQFIFRLYSNIREIAGLQFFGEMDLTEFGKEKSLLRIIHFGAYYLRAQNRISPFRNGMFIITKYHLIGDIS
jgi:hypothetical protein